MNIARTALAISLLTLAIAVAGLAQTAVWIAPGPSILPPPLPSTTTADWHAAGNWDTGVVPNGSGVTAIINQSVSAGAMSPRVGGAYPVITGNVTLAELRFDLPTVGTTHFNRLYIGSQDPAGPAGRLRLEGIGITMQKTGTSAYTDVNLFVQPGSFLDFGGQASVARTGLIATSLYVTGTATRPAYIRFFDEASPGALQEYFVNLSGPTVWEFRDRSSAGNIGLRLSPESTVTFFGRASAGTSKLHFLYNGTDHDAAVRFADNSTAAQCVLSSTDTRVGAVEFIDQATGGGATITNLRRIDISGASTGTGSTGRLRATTNALSPTTVFADDARTITLGNVIVQDVLLGSNTLEVTGGSIGLIRDTGGAYLSAAGGNLAGGGLIKTGSGSLYLRPPTLNPADPLQPGYFVMTGPTIIRQGEVWLYNRIASATVESAGVLSGSGTINGHLLNQGRVAPSYWYINYSGMGMQVTGNFTQAGSGTYFYDTNNLYWYPNSPALLQIGGTATLAGRLEVSSTSPDIFPNRQPGTLTKTVLTAGGITGRFDSVQLSYNEGFRALLPITTVYSPTSVTLRYDLLPVAALAQTPSQQALATYLDRIYQWGGWRSPDLLDYQYIVDGLRTLLSPDEVTRSLNNFAPDRYGAIFENGVVTANSRRASLDRVLSATREAGSRRSSFFLEGSQHRYTAESVDQLPSVKSRTNNWIAGGTWQRGAWSIGAYVAEDKSHLTLDQAGSRAEVESVEPGLFAHYRRGGFFAHAAAGFSRDHYELQRNGEFVFWPKIRFVDSATPHGKRHDYSATVGWIWRHPKWTFKPLAGFEFTDWQVDDFTETTTSTEFRIEPMIIENWSRDSRRARVGAELSGQLWNGRVRPRLTATWWHEFETDRTIPARFAGELSGYLAPGRPAEIDVVQVGLGLDCWISDRLVFSATALGARGDYTNQATEFIGGLRWDF